ncbi:MAG TPA: hypothetical protein VGZ29_00705 [Terriglobia bacterium]|nr:hypothetical protein [Terriglobia bacterium]
MTAAHLCAADTLNARGSGIRHMRALHLCLVPRFAPLPVVLFFMPAEVLGGVEALIALCASMLGAAGLVLAAAEMLLASA